MLADTTCPTAAVTFCVTVANPGAATSSRYSPGRSRGNRKLPLLSVFTLWTAPDSKLLSVTLASATAAPVGSVTFPAMSPEMIVCAETNEQLSPTIIPIHNSHGDRYTPNRLFIRLSPNACNSVAADTQRELRCAINWPPRHAAA